MIKPATYNIGLSIGTRSIGVAIIQRHELRSYKVLVFKKPWSKQKLRIILQQLRRILTLPGCFVGIKVPPPAYRSRQLKQLLTAVALQLNKQSAQYKLFTIDDLKAHCFPHQKSNKRALLQCIGKKYPQLYLKYERETQNRHAHYTKLFEATIAAELINSENAQ
jgi:hypothetical protein